MQLKLTVPIEEAFTSVKYYLRDHHELYQAIEDPISIIRSAFNNITTEQCLS